MFSFSTLLNSTVDIHFKIAFPKWTGIQEQIGSPTAPNDVRVTHVMWFDKEFLSHEVFSYSYGETNIIGLSYECCARSRYQGQGQILRDVIICACLSYLLLAQHSSVSRTGTSNYTPQILWGVITCACPWYMLLAQHPYHKCSMA